MKSCKIFISDSYLISNCTSSRVEWCQNSRSLSLLTLKAPIATAADDIHKYFLIFFPEKIRRDISCESSARQRIHMKLQALFSSKNKSKKIKVSSAAIFVWHFKG